MESQKKVLYVCDHRACEVCSNPEHLMDLCNHTFDVRHAENFKNQFGVLKEKIHPPVE